MGVWGARANENDGSADLWGELLDGFREQVRWRLSAPAPPRRWPPPEGAESMTAAEYHALCAETRMHGETMACWERLGVITQLADRLPEVVAACREQAKADLDVVIHDAAWRATWTNPRKLAKEILRLRIQLALLEEPERGVAAGRTPRKGGAKPKKPAKVKLKAAPRKKRKAAK
jgi:hypothetical protein